MVAVSFPITYKLGNALQGSCGNSKVIGVVVFSLLLLCCGWHITFQSWATVGALVITSVF